MKKFAKLSLVAAVAVAGLSSTASAAALEEAIKNTSISGQFRYRTNQAENAAASTEVEVEVGVKTKITDTVTAVFKIDSDPDQSDSSSANRDELKVEDYYFSYSNNGTTVNLGQQNIPARTVYGVQGDGVVALQNVNGFTIGAAYFMNNSHVGTTASPTNLGDNAVTSVLATGSVAGVSVLAQYAEIANHSDVINVKADTTVSGIKLGAEYTDRDLDGQSQDLNTTKISASGKIANVALAATYVTTGKDGSGSLDGSVLGASEYTGYKLHSAGRSDASFTVVKATVPVAPKTSITVYHADGEEGSTDITETFGQVSYKASKNLNAYVRVGDYDNGTTTVTNSRLEIKYSF